MNDYEIIQAAHALMEQGYDAEDAIHYLTKRIEEHERQEAEIKEALRKWREGRS